MRTICGGGDDMRKPDAAAKFPTGQVNMCEVCSGKGSKRQSAASQREKLSDMRGRNGLGPGEDEVVP